MAWDQYTSGYSWFYPNDKQLHQKRTYIKEPI